MQERKNDVRQARSFLGKRGIPPTLIRPEDFASVARKLSKSFGETLEFIKVLRAGGQGLGPAPQGRAIAEKKGEL